MQQLRQIIPALMIGVLAGGIGTFQSLQSNQASILSSSYGNGGNPQFTTQSVVGEQRGEQLPPQGDGELKIGKKFIPCPGSEKYLDSKNQRGIYIAYDNWEIATKYTPDYKNEFIESPFILDPAKTHAHKVILIYSGIEWTRKNYTNICVYNFSDDSALYSFDQKWCAPINEPTRIGFECDIAEQKDPIGEGR